MVSAMMNLPASEATCRLGGQPLLTPLYRHPRLQRCTTSAYAGNGTSGNGTGYSNGSTGYQSQTQTQTRTLGNTASASNRAALQQQIGAPVDISMETVTTQNVPANRKSYRVSFFDAMKFNGPAPERINARLAMVAFLTGSVAEYNTGATLIEQAKSNPILGLLLAFWVSWATLIPIMKGARSEAFGIFSPRAEIWNGRAAMIGIAALLFLEYTPDASFF